MGAHTAAQHLPTEDLLLTGIFTGDAARHQLLWVSVLMVDADKTMKECRIFRIVEFFPYLECWKDELHVKTFSH